MRLLSGYLLLFPLFQRHHRAPNKAYICMSSDFTVLKPCLLCLQGKDEGKANRISPSTAGAVSALDMDFPFCAPITTSCQPCSDTVAPHSHRLGCSELPAWAVPPLWVWMRTSSLISCPCNKTDSIRSTSLHPPVLNSLRGFIHLLICFLPGNLS